jgi:5-oxoprolinase (ATP-hydrolysing) subunit A
MNASGQRLVDLNADVGEGFGRWSLGDDDALMPIITSANVACGFHAGDPTIIHRTCSAAVRHGVAIGAQVSYPDLAGFGRRFIDIDPGELTDAVVYQIGALEAMARVAGGRVVYVKPHGALYNAVVHHTAQADAVAHALRLHDGDLALLGLPNSAIQRAAESRGIRFVVEGFADRGYRVDGTLVPRTEPGALLTDPSAVAEQTTSLVGRGVDSICVHSDTPDAAALATTVRTTLAELGAGPTAFAR